MKLPILVEETIRLRKSVRTFDEKNIEEQKQEQIRQFLQEINDQAGGGYRILWLNMRNLNGKVGTYGMIAGAQYYLAGVVHSELGGTEQFGYAFETAILYITALGLGTCWLGGIDRKSFEEKIDIKDGESVAVASPVGYAKAKRSFKDNMVRKIAGSDSRKPWEELFAGKTSGLPFGSVEAGDYATALEMVRLAPSASNKQPWRVMRDEQGFHFFLKRNQGYAEKIPFDLQKSDVGIAMCHFEQTALEKGLTGEWLSFDNVFRDGMTYIRTWVPGNAQK